jgi:fucose 4-O-acetylase-like acetyltransferase
MYDMIIKDQQNNIPVDWVLIAKGLGISLVVLGHFDPPSSPGYWTNIRDIVYSFHMPLFFILSGYLYTHHKYSYSDLIKIKTRRLLFPFVSVALVFFLIKFAANHFVPLQYPVNLQSIYSLLINPIHSYMPLLWFVHALFLIFAIYPLARLVTNDIFLLLLTIVANLFWENNLPFFSNMLHNVPFFIAGAILKNTPTLSIQALSPGVHYILFSISFFILTHTTRIFFINESNIDYILRFLLGIFGSSAIIIISKTILFQGNNITRKLLSQIGYYSMSIYLFHTLFESSVRIGFLHILKGVDIPFEFVAFTAIISGIVFPFLLEKYVLRQYSITRKYLLGLS